MDPTSRSSSSPSKVLAPVPPQRMNQQVLSETHSLHSDSLQEQLKNPKAISDVQTRVALLNSLSRGNSPAPTTSSSGTNAALNAALQRAVIGREEAESSLASISAQLSEGHSRERRISERLESLLEELHSAKERQAHERSIFEKEIRKARKEAFRASSALVKLQDELKSSKTEINVLRDGVSSEREAKDQAEREALERADTVSTLTNELKILKRKLQFAEENNKFDSSEAKTHRNREESLSSTEFYDPVDPSCEDIGKTSLAQDNAAVMAPGRQGNLKRSSEAAESPFPDSESVSDVYGLTPLKKQRVWSEFVTPKHDEDTIRIESPNLRIMELRAKLQWEKKLRTEAEKTIEFMCIECQFKACRCRMAESEGKEYVYDVEYDRRLKATKKAKEEARIERGEGRHPDGSETKGCHHFHPPARPDSSAGTEVETSEGGSVSETQGDLLITFSPETGTFRSVPSPVRSPGNDNKEDMSAVSQPAGQKHEGIDLLTQSPVKSEIDDQSRFEHTAKVTVPMYDFSSPTPPTRTTKGRKSGILLSPGDGSEEAMGTMGHSTSTTVPLRTEEDEPVDSFAPGTPVSREAALAQIRARRGKAQGVTRCASAAEGNIRPGGMGVTPIRGAKRIPGLQANAKPQNDMRERRDLSAPTRLFRK